MHIPVIFEDENILVIDKPSGIVVHPFDFSTEDTLLDFFAEHIPESFSIMNSVVLQDKRKVQLGGIVHKLDRDTSGVMVITKNQKTFDELKWQFQNHTIQKIYTALVDGVIEKDHITIDSPLGREKKGYKQVVNPKNPRGELRDALTEVLVLARNESKTLVQLEPKTGRTHQLRAHMSSIGHPIVGDIAYGSTTASERIMLHAQKLSCIVNDTHTKFVAPAPEEFTL